MNRTISVYATLPMYPTEANFTVSQPIITSPIFEFNGGSSSNVTRYEWDFGDGEYNYTAQPVHTYAKAGTYTVTLTTKNYDISTYGAYSTPVVWTITPQSGHAGNNVTIGGYNFNGVTAVQFGSTNTTGTDLLVDGSGKQITVKVPTGSGTVDVNVFNPIYESTSSVTFEYT